MATQAELLEAMNRYLVPNYGPRSRAMVRGRGARIWDADGNEYVDFFAGFGGGGIGGHCHPRIVEAIKAQADRLLSHGNFFTNERELELARRIEQTSFPGKAFFCHSGAEANEAALKLVRLAAGEGRYKILYFTNGFHGRTMGGLSLTSGKYQKGFEPMLAGGVEVAYNDLGAVRGAIDDQTAGIFVEPIQGEGGVNLPSAEFMQGLRAVCDENGLVLVCDEVWASPARTGRWFAHQHYGVVPDVMTLAKAVGGGAPVGICWIGRKYADVLGPGTHGCTMGGNPLCTSAGAAAMKLIEEEGLVEQAARKGERITRAVRDARVPAIREVRGLGLMIGIEIDKPARDVFRACLERGLFVAPARESVIRFAPPLTIGEEDISAGLEIFFDVLRQ